MTTDIFEVMPRAEIEASLAEMVTNVKSLGAKGDGVTDDTTAIQNAYNSLSTGGTLFFPAGNYKVTQTLNFNLSNVNLVGVGAASCIQILSNQQADGTRIHINNCSNVFIRDLKVSEVNQTLVRANVYGTFGLDTVTNLFMENVEVNGANGVGIHGMNCQDVTIIKPYVHNTMADGIHFQRGSKNIKIYSPEVHETQDDCISFPSHAANQFGQCDGIYIEGGNLGNTTVTGSGICGDGSLNIKIRNVKIKSTQLAGIRIEPLTDSGNATVYPANVDISGVTVDTTGLTTGSGVKPGIHVQNVNNLKIKDVILRNCFGGIYGIGLNGLIDIDNIEGYNSTERFIWLTSATVGSNNFVIIKVKNSLSKICTSDGIYVDCSNLKADYVSVSNNDLIDINNGNTTGITGIFIGTAANAIIEHNKAYSKNTITKVYTTACDTLMRVSNLPLDENELTYIGAGKHSRAGAVPTSGTWNVGDVVWNWNPQQNTAIGWTCVTAGTPGIWRQIALVMTS